MSPDKLNAALVNLLTHVDRGTVALPPTRAECAYLARAILATLGPRPDPSLVDHMRKWLFTLPKADLLRLGPERMAAAFVERHVGHPSDFEPQQADGFAAPAGSRCVICKEQLQGKPWGRPPLHHDCLNAARDEVVGYARARHIWEEYMQRMLEPSDADQAKALKAADVYPHSWLLNELAGLLDKRASRR